MPKEKIIVLLAPGLYQPNKKPIDLSFYKILFSYPLSEVLQDPDSSIIDVILFDCRGSAEQQYYALHVHEHDF